jgi:phospholipid N-methyltransferase
MPPQARLLCVELNPLFYRLIRSIQDNRLTAHLGSAAELKDILVLHGLPAPDVIISGIPFSTMSRSTGSGILATIATLLAPGGRFVAYQASDRVVDLSEPFLGTGQTQLEFLNIPPMRVCRWEKPDTRTDTGTDSSAPGRQHRAEDTYR